MIGSRNYRKIIVFPTITISELRYGDIYTQCSINQNIKRRRWRFVTAKIFFSVPNCSNNFVCFWLACLDPMGNFTWNFLSRKCHEVSSQSFICFDETWTSYKLDSQFIVPKCYIFWKGKIAILFPLLSVFTYTRFQLSLWNLVKHSETLRNFGKLYFKLSMKLHTNFNSWNFPSLTPPDYSSVQKSSKTRFTTGIYVVPGSCVVSSQYSDIASMPQETNFVRKPR